MLMIFLYQVLGSILRILTNREKKNGNAYTIFFFAMASEISTAALGAFTMNGMG